MSNIQSPCVSDSFAPMRAHNRRVWQARAPEGANVDVSGSEEITPLQAQLLALRGIESSSQAHDFVHARLKQLPDPLLLPDMHKALQRIIVAIRNGERIAVHGDYDVDGISATSVLYLALEVISVDCGISAIEEATLAYECGIDLIITDHHQPGDERPPAFACVNPWLEESAFPYKPLCGAGVAFMLVVALYSRLRRANMAPPGFDIRMLLDLVTLGTVADLVPLTGVNRIFVRAGLPLLEGDYRPGICKLREVAGVDRVNAGVVGFRLAPRLNAGGRLADAARGVELLLSDNTEVAHNIADELDQCNRERQEIEETTLQHALARIEAELCDSCRTIVLADSNWHSGVIGIVASRLVELFHRPVILIAIDPESGIGKGSGRSIHGLNLYHALKHCRAWMVGYGGHEFAAGLSIEAHNVEHFAQALEEYTHHVLSPEQLIPRATYDLELPLDDISAGLYEELQALAPFGMGNPEPVFLCRNLNVQQAGVVGKNHLRFRVQQGGYSLPCIAFGCAPKIEMLQGRVDILFQIDTNTWQGRTSLQLKVKDIRPAAESSVDVT
ncbi:MAG: single-stranded-DNA-specific exonuclease RecJ [Geobacteraceae bacterium]|nr:single-stranded-DNA-specific exonuclease RecJ [Geobacteraceae bacterium]